MNASTDIGYCAEQVMIEILSTVPALALLKPTHEDADTDSTYNRIVVQAVHVLPLAPNANVPQKNVRQVEMQISIRAAVGQSTAGDLYSAYGTMCQTIEAINGAAYGSLPSVAQFSFLQPMLNLENEREKEENRRKMIKTFNFVAILA